MSPQVSDALFAAIWLFANVLLIAAVWQGVSRRFSSDPALEKIMHCVVIAWASIAAAALTLGAIGCLSAGALLALVGGGAAALLKASVRGTRIRCHSADHEPPEIDGFTLAWGLLSALALGMVATTALVQFPTDWDSLMYHIPMADQWLRAGNLYAPDEAIWQFPGNNELLTLWLVAPFSGDFLAALGNLPSVALLALATIALARQLDLRPVSCHLAGFAAVGNSIVLRQLCDNENDVAVAALFIACLAYAFRSARRLRRADVCLGALCAGLLAGIKYYALAYMGVAAVVTVVLTWLVRDGRSAIRAASLGASAVLIWAGYWYLRNVLVSGTPLYPFGLTDDTDVLSEMRNASTFSSTLLGNGWPEVGPLLREAILTRIGPAHWIAFMLCPIIVAWLSLSALVMIRRGGKASAAARRLVLALAVLGAAAAYGVTPFAVETEPGTMNTLRGGYLPSRFGLSFLTLAVVGFVVLLDDLHVGLLALCGRARGIALPPTRRAWRGSAMFSRGFSTGIPYAPQALYASLIAWQIGYDRFQALPDSTVVDAVLAGADIALDATCCRLLAGPAASRRRRAILSAAIALGLCAAIAWRGEQWRDGYAAHYDRHFRTQIFTRLAAEAPAQTRICACTYQYYPFLGANRQFRASRPFLAPTYDSLLAYLDEHQSTFIATTNHDLFKNGRYLEIKKWLDAHPERFQSLESGPWLSFYRVLPASADVETP